MTLISIRPQENKVEFGSEASVSGVDMSSVDPTIDLIQFNSDTNSGFIQFLSETPDYPSKAPETIFSLAPWAEQVQEAERIIYCENNPKTFYKTVPPIGFPVLVREKDWPQPENTSEEAPPEKPEEGTTLYWNGGEFVWSVYPIDLPLPDAKEFLKGLVNKEAYSRLVGTDWYLVREFETGVQTPQEIRDWRESIRSAANEKQSTIDEKSSPEDLREYSLSENFNNWPTLNS